jgi:hypothetical protein
MRRGSEWRAFYESAREREKFRRAENAHLRSRKRCAVRQKELRTEPSDFPERGELAAAETALIRLKSEKLRWPVLEVQS